MLTKKPTKMLLVPLAIASLWLTTTFAAMQIPEKLAPAPLYSGAKIIQVMDMGQSSMAMLQTKASLEALIEFYKKAMKEKGWKVAFQAEQEDNAIIHFTKDKMAIQITASKGDEDGMLHYQMVAVEQ
jgi:hypothetical protein